MQIETIYSDGRNEFKYNKFSFDEWSAPTIIRAEEVRNFIDSFRLERRKIRNIRFVGSAWNLKDIDIENPDINIYAKLQLYAEITEPLLIEFEDGDVFEIVSYNQPEFRMSMNCIPWDIRSDESVGSIDAEALFSGCIGHRITVVELKTQALYAVTSSNPNQDETCNVVTKLYLWLDDGNRICIESYQGFCYVSLINLSNEVCTIRIEDLMYAVYRPKEPVDDSEGLTVRIGRSVTSMKNAIGEWISKLIGGLDVSQDDDF